MKNSIRYIEAAVVAVAFLAGAYAVSANPAKGHTAICHATSSEKNPYIYLVLPPAALGGHLDKNGTSLAGHEQDYFPADSDCDRSNDPSGVPEDPPAATPEPLTILLFGAGLTGVGYVSRRYLRKRSGEDELGN